METVRSDEETDNVTVVRADFVSHVESRFSNQSGANGVVSRVELLPVCWKYRAGSCRA